MQGRDQRKSEEFEKVEFEVFGRGREPFLSRERSGRNEIEIAQILHIEKS